MVIFCSNFSKHTRAVLSWIIIFQYLQSIYTVKLLFVRRNLRTLKACDIFLEFFQYNLFLSLHVLEMNTEAMRSGVFTILL